MKTSDAIDALAALAHEHRLAIYRLLVRQGPEGMAAGAIANRVALVPSSLTFHLQSLKRAGLVTQRREGRKLIYGADYTAMNGLVGYLTENCCMGAQDAAPACAPTNAPSRVRKSAKTA